MPYGTVIQRRSRDSFIIQAMLSSYLSVGEKDYIELLLPFVLCCLPVRVGELIDIGTVQSNLNAQFDLDILYNVVYRLLRRLCKKKKGCYVERRDGQYYVKAVYDPREFDERKRQIRVAMDSVIAKLQKFVVEKKGKKVTQNDASNYLALFLETYNYTVYRDARSAGTITIKDEVAESNYYVAQFILEEYDGDTVEFSYIKDLIEGTLVAKAIYYFMSAPDEGQHRAIKGTDFYLDTRVLIDILGLDTVQGNHAALELIGIIKELGGKLKTFSYYVEELKGIIRRYLETPEIRLSLSLQYFVREKIPTPRVIVYGQTLELRLREMGVEVVPKPDYGENIVSQSWHIDYAKVRNELSANIAYRGNGNGYYPLALENDATTIEAISYYRGSRGACSVFSCGAIFVTENSDIANVVYRLFCDERFSKNEVNFAITDVDLTAVLWFNSFRKQKKIPVTKLLENAYAACAPTKAVMQAFLEEIDRLGENEEISRESAVLLRTQLQSMDDLTKLTHNRSDRVGKAVIKEMDAIQHNRVYKEVKAEVYDEIRKQALEKQKEVFEDIRQQEERIKEAYEELAVSEEKAEFHLSELQAVKGDVVGLLKRMVEEQKDLDFKSQRLEIQKARNKEEKQALLEEKRALDEARDAIVCFAKRRAEESAVRLKRVLYVLSVITGMAVIGGFAFGTYCLSDWSGLGEALTCIMVGGISVITTAGSVISYVKWGCRKIKAVGERVYDKKYAEYVQLGMRR